MTEDTEARFYGIDTLKSLSIACSVLLHAYTWTVFSYGRQVPPLPLSIGIFLGSMTMAMPMTAMAVLALSKAIRLGPKRLEIVDGYETGSSLLFLALLESVKGAWLYGPEIFFAWNVLHCVAFTVALILAVGRYSLSLLWIVAATIVLATPTMVRLLGPREQEILHENVAGPTAPWATITRLASLWLAFAWLAWGIRRLRLPSQHRLRLSSSLACICLLLSFLVLREKSSPFAITVLRALPIGALIGTSGPYLHVWGIFPWAGVSILGFLFFHQLLQGGPMKRFAPALLVTGLALLAGVYHSSRFEIGNSLSKESYISADLINRTPSWAFSTIGAFCVFAPLAFWLESSWRLSSYTRRLSHSILWIYLYQTFVMVLIYRALENRMAYPGGAWLIAALSILGSCLIPLMVTRMPLRIRLRLERRDGA